MSAALQPITPASFMNRHGEGTLSETSPVDEPNSKRPRVEKITLHSHAEVVEDGMAASKASSTKFGIASPVNTSGVPLGNEENLFQGSLYKGQRVCMRGLDARPQLNGQAGQILGFHPAQSRWLVSLDDGSKKLVLSANLQPVTPQTASRTSVENTDADPAQFLENGEEDAPDMPFMQAESFGGAKPGYVFKVGKQGLGYYKSDMLSISSAAAAPSVSSCTPPQDLLMAELRSSRSQALRRVDVVSGETCAQVGQVRSDVQQSCDSQQQKFLQYCEMSKPRDHHHQCARNNMRKELREVAEAVLSSMQQLFEASVEPTAALRAAEAEQLANIDSMMNTLSVFRAETAAMFEDYSEKVEVDRQATKNTVVSLASGIEPVNKFMQCFAQEVQHESAEANSLHQEQLQDLKKEEADHVASNGDPDQNPVFAKVQDDLAAVKRLLEEQASNNASHSSLMQSWESMWNLMPSKKLVVEADPPRRGVWGRFWG